MAKYAKSRERQLGPWSTNMSLPRKHTWYYFNGSAWVETYSNLTNDRSRSGFISLKPYVTPTPATSNSFDTTDVTGCLIVCNLGGVYSGLNRYIHPPTGAHSGWAGSPDPVPLDSAIVEANYQALKRLRQKADSISKLMTTVAEFPETVSMVGGFVNHLTGAHNKAMVKINRSVKVRRMTKQTPATIARFVADARLAYSLGIKPAISDAQSVGEAVAAMFTNFRYQHIRVYEKRVGQHYTASTVTATANVAPNIPLDIYETSEREYQLIMGGTYVHDDQAGNNLSRAELFGLSINDVGPALWELIPYSWLVDYFTNISDILDAVKNNVKLKYTWKIEINDRSYKGLLFPRLPQGWTQIGAIRPGYSKARSFSFNRSTPGFIDQVPDFRLERPGWNQIANIAALSAQKLIKPVSFVFGNKKKEVLSILSSQKLS